MHTVVVTLQSKVMWNQSSGPVRAVLLTLLFMMVACFGVAIERAMFIGRSRRESKELVSKIMPLLQRGDQAGNLCCCK